MTTVAAIWRHPIKAHGREAIERVVLIAGQTMPWDRHWAVTHDAGSYDGGWAPCQTFMIGMRTPGLAAIWARLDEDTATVHLRHADLGSFSFRPDDATQQAAFFDWIAPICPAGRASPDSVVTAGARGMTDSAYPSVSILNLASHRAVAAQLGQDIEPERWRCNIWLESLSAWSEFDWIGREIRIGGATLRVRERIKRCMLTATNPATGQRDADTLGGLKAGWDHTDFGIYAEVITGGPVACTDTCEVI